MALMAGKKKKKEDKKKAAAAVEEPKKPVDTAVSAVEMATKAEKAEEPNTPPINIGADDFIYIVENVDKHIEDIQGTINRYANQLSDMGVLDDVRVGGLKKMLVYIKPRDVIDEAYGNYKNRISFR